MPDPNRLLNFASVYALSSLERDDDGAPDAPARMWSLLDTGKGQVRTPSKHYRQHQSGTHGLYRNRIVPRGQWPSTAHLFLPRRRRACSAKVSLSVVRH